MLCLTRKDKEVIYDSYRAFLSNLKCFLEKDTVVNAFDCAKIIIYMLRNGQFCIDKSIIFNNQFQYLSLSNMNYDGVYVMYGICCCRHASALLNDILQVLGFDSSLLYIFIDKNDNWYVSSTMEANHLTVLLRSNDIEYILDPVNNFIFKKERDQRLTLLDLGTFDISSNYQDFNIQKIGKVLRKYYHLQQLGVDYVYDYEY